MLVSEILRKTTATRGKEDKSEKISNDANSLLRKFSCLSVNIRKANKQKNTKLDERLKDLEKEMQDYGSPDQIIKLNSSLDTLLTYLEEITDEAHKSNETRRGRVKNTQENFQNHIEDLRQISREILNGFSKESEKQLFAVELAIKKHQKVFNEQMNHYELGINESLDFLEKEVERETIERDIRMGEIEAEVVNNLEMIEEDILTERELREQTENKVRELIEEMNNDIDEKIVKEKKERERSNNNLLGLLEQACSKLEKNFGQY